jgi:hypothetical protein
VQKRSLIRDNNASEVESHNKALCPNKHSELHPLLVSSCRIRHAREPHTGQEHTYFEMLRLVPDMDQKCLNGEPRNPHINNREDETTSHPSVMLVTHACHVLPVNETVHSTSQELTVYYTHYKHATNIGGAK